MHASFLNLEHCTLSWDGLTGCPCSPIATSRTPTRSAGGTMTAGKMMTVVSEFWFRRISTIISYNFTSKSNIILWQLVNEGNCRTWSSLFACLLAFLWSKASSSENRRPHVVWHDNTILNPPAHTSSNSHFHFTHMIRRHWHATGVDPFNKMLQVCIVRYTYSSVKRG